MIIEFNMYLFTPRLNVQLTLSLSHTHIAVYLFNSRTKRNAKDIMDWKILNLQLYNIFCVTEVLSTFFAIGL